MEIRFVIVFIKQRLRVQALTGVSAGAICDVTSQVYHPLFVWRTVHLYWPSDRFIKLASSLSKGDI